MLTSSLPHTAPKPITVTFPVAGKITGLGQTTLWGLAKSGKLELVRIGRRTLITYASLERLLTPSATGAVDSGASHPDGQPRKQRSAPESAHTLG